MSTEATVFFPTLLSVLKVGAHTLRNRTLMGSMHTRLESLDQSIGNARSRKAGAKMQH